MLHSAERLKTFLVSSCLQFPYAVPFRLARDSSGILCMQCSLVASTILFMEANVCCGKDVLSRKESNI